MSRLSRPLNKKAIQKADNEFYDKHPELIKEGKRIPLSTTDVNQKKLRKEWGALYKKQGGKIENNNEKLPDKKPEESVAKCPPEEKKVVANNNCDDFYVTSISGPSLIRIGEKVEYVINGYNATETQEDCKDKVKWRVEVYGKCDVKKPIWVIEDCSMVSGVFKIEKDKLIILKAPSFWLCCIAVYAYVKSPTVNVRQITQVKGDINPILLFERRHNPNAADMRFGDMTNEQFKVFYLPVSEREFTIKLIQIDNLNDNPFKIFGPKPLWQNDKYIKDNCNKEYDGFVKKSDAKHFEKFKSLIEWQSTGELETVALDILNKFKENRANKGKNYESSVLNRRAKEHESPKRFLNNEIIPQLKKALFDAKGDIHNMNLFDNSVMGIPRFNTYMDKVQGLGIIFNGTLGSKIELIDYECIGNDRFRAKIRITIYDHFGLDIDDIRIDNPDEERVHMKIHPFKFLAWAYLQRVRGFKPFTTQVQYEETIEDSF